MKIVQIIIKKLSKLSNTIIIFVILKLYIKNIENPFKRIKYILMKKLVKFFIFLILTLIN